MVPAGHTTYYADDIQQDERGRPTRSIFEKPQIITSGLESIPRLQDTIAWYRLQWLAALSGKYSPSLVRELFASYAAIVLGSLSKGKRPLISPN